MRKFQIIITNGKNTVSTFEKGHSMADCVRSAAKKQGWAMKDVEIITRNFQGRKPFSLQAGAECYRGKCKRELWG